MSTDPKTNKDELTDEQAENIAGGRMIGGGDADGALDANSIRKLDGASADSPPTGTRDAESQ